jgi:hypothetical protein
LEVTFPSVSANHFYKKKKKKNPTRFTAAVCCSGCPKNGRGRGSGYELNNIELSKTQTGKGLKNILNRDVLKNLK